MNSANWPLKIITLFFRWKIGYTALKSTRAIKNLLFNLKRVKCCVYLWEPRMIFWQKINQIYPVLGISLVYSHRIAQYGRPPTCLFITQNVHFPNFSYSNFGYTRNTRPNKENSRENVYISKLQLRRCNWTFCHRVYVVRVWRRQPATAAAVPSIGWSEQEWVQVVCSFVSFRSVALLCITLNISLHSWFCL